MEGIPGALAALALALALTLAGCGPSADAGQSQALEFEPDLLSPVATEAGARAVDPCELDWLAPGCHKDDEQLERPEELAFDSGSWDLGGEPDP